MGKLRKYQKDIETCGELATANKFKKTYIQKIPNMFAEGKSLIEIASELNVSKSTIYAWKEKHPELKRNLAMAREMTLDNLEVTLMKRANGFTAPNGEYILPDVTALKFALTKLRRAKFGEDEKTININHNNTSGQSLEEINEKIKMLEEKNKMNLLEQQDIEDADFDEIDYEDGDNDE
jgi:predicted DNA-binding protein YlxM (UPF0122 family)